MALAPPAGALSPKQWHRAVWCTAPLPSAEVGGGQKFWWPASFCVRWCLEHLAPHAHPPTPRMLTSPQCSAEAQSEGPLLQIPQSIYPGGREAHPDRIFPSPAPELQGGPGPCPALPCRKPFCQCLTAARPCSWARLWAPCAGAQELGLRAWTWAVTVLCTRGLLQPRLPTAVNAGLKLPQPQV